MNWLLTFAVVLIALWVLFEVLGWVVGAALHLLWIAALVLFVVWLVGKVRRRV